MSALPRELHADSALCTNDFHGMTPFTLRPGAAVAEVDVSGWLRGPRSNQGVLKHMKKITLLLSALFIVAGVASASQATSPAAPAAKAAVAKTHVVEAEVVSADVTAKTLTIKGDPNKTVPVDAAAVAHLKTLKAGEKVKLTCRDNDKGEHQAISQITVEKAPATK